MRHNTDRFYVEASGGHRAMFHVSAGRTSLGAKTVLVRIWRWLFQVAWRTDLPAEDTDRTEEE